MKKSIFFAICFCLMVSASNAKMQNPDDFIRLPAGKWWYKPNIVKSLRITDDEKKTLDNLFLNHRKQLIDLQSAIAKEQLTLGQVVDQPFNESAYLAQFQSYQNARVNLGAERFKYFLQVRKLLGDERFKLFKSFSKKIKNDK